MRCLSNRATRLRRVFARGAAGTGVVQGRVRGPAYKDFSGCLIVLTNNRTGKTISPTTNPPVNPDGSYHVTGVPPGEWKVHCIPNPSIALAAMSYRQRPGFLNPHAATVQIYPGQVYTANFVLAAAARMNVHVADNAGNPASGVYVLSYDAGTQAFTTPPALTDAAGNTILTNVPLASKLAVVPPSEQGAGFVDPNQGSVTGTVWQTAPIVQLPAQGDTNTYVSVSLT